MKVIIEIPDKDIPKQQELMSVNLTFMNGILCECDYPFNVVKESEDCVNRQYLVEKAVSWDKHFANGIRYVALTDILNAPPVTPQTKTKTGHWIDTGSGQECSECGEIQYGYDNFRNYCANCGIKMEVYDATDN